MQTKQIHNLAITYPIDMVDTTAIDAAETHVRRAERLETAKHVGMNVLSFMGDYAASIAANTGQLVMTLAREAKQDFGK